MTRMAIAVQDDRGTYSILPGTRPQPWNILEANLHDDLAYEIVIKIGIEPLVGWGPWTYGILVNKQCVAFIDGEEPKRLFGQKL